MRINSKMQERKREYKFQKMLKARLEKQEPR